MAIKNLVFLHGWSFSPNYFDFLKPFFPSKFKIFTPTLPGFGTEKISRPYNLTDYANWLNHYLSIKKINNSLIVGHSFGGAVTTKYLAVHQNSVRKLVLVDAAIIRDSPTSLHRLFYTILKIIKPVVSVPLIKNTALKIFGLENSDYQNIKSPAMKETFRNILYENLVDEISEIKIPVLLIWGKNDQSTPIKYAYRLNKIIKKSKLVVFPNSDHFPFIDEPEKFVSEIVKFLK